MIRRALSVTALTLALTAPALAQQTPPAATAADQQKLNMAAFQKALSQDRRQLFSANMNLSAKDFEAFWGVYGEYEKEREALGKTRMDLLKNYAAGFGNMSDADVTKLAGDYTQYQRSDIALREKYFGLVSQKVSVPAAARFFQIDDYIQTVTKLALLNQIPFIGDER